MLLLIIQSAPPPPPPSLSVVVSWGILVSYFGCDLSKYDTSQPSITISREFDLGDVHVPRTHISHGQCEQIGPWVGDWMTTDQMFPKKKKIYVLER